MVDNKSEAAVIGGGDGLGVMRWEWEWVDLEWRCVEIDEICVCADNNLGAEGGKAIAPSLACLTNLTKLWIDCKHTQIGVVCGDECGSCSCGWAAG